MPDFLYHNTIYLVCLNGFEGLYMNNWKPFIKQAEPMQYLTLSQAAKETGKSKGTLSKALKTGKISYVEKTDAGYKIDPAELFRVYPRNQSNAPQNEQSTTPEETQFLTLLLEQHQAQNDQLQATIKDLRARLDRSEDERQALSLRLEQPTKRKRFLIF